MGSFRSGLGWGAALLAFLLSARTPLAAAQASPEAPRPSKSVYGKLESVDPRQNALFMVSDAGERLAWRFAPAVIAEASRFAPGGAMIVIYRQIALNEKRVTAVAFPGTAATPTYVNATGARVALRSGAAVNDACGQPDAGPIQEVTIPEGGRAEITQACWCCASAGETCTPGNRSGVGQALLVGCFE